jgi:hypothetical protein
MTQRALETERGVPWKLLILGWSGTALPVSAEPSVSVDGAAQLGGVGSSARLSMEQACDISPGGFFSRATLTAHGGGGDAATEQRGRHGYGGAAGDGHGRALQEHGVGGVAGQLVGVVWVVVKLVRGF